MILTRHHLGRWPHELRVDLVALAQGEHDTATPIDDSNKQWSSGTMKQHPRFVKISWFSLSFLVPLLLISRSPFQLNVSLEKHQKSIRKH